MIRPITGLWSFLLSVVIFIPTPAFSQTALRLAKPAGPLSYDVSKEVTLSGTVSSLLTKPSPGMIMGAHLLLQTKSGVVDASLGRFALRGYGALEISGGEAVSVTGVMKTLNGKQVLLSRIVRVANQVYTIRNQHGIPLTPLARERLSEKASGQGVQP
jgi:hypothetical protein